MRARIGFLRTSKAITSILRSDGWRLDALQTDDCVAHHPDLKDEAGLRERLYRLGLLTSTSVRIAFFRGDQPQATGEK